MARNARIPNSMSVPWIGILIGVFAAFFMLSVRWLVSKLEQRHVSNNTVETSSPTIRSRALYFAWGVCFPVVLIIALLFARHNLPASRQAEGIGWGLAAISWLVLGGVPLSLAAMGGRQRLAVFKSNLERHAGSSFRSFLIVWIAGIALMTIVSLRGMLI